MEKLNIAELLKDCPKGMELDCTMYDGVEFMGIDTESDTIILRIGNKFIRRLNKYGQDDNIDCAKCVIFPKGKTTWEGFQRPFKDGDILAYQYPHYTNPSIYIHKYSRNLNTAFYVALSGNGDFKVSDKYRETLYGNDSSARFATEEEKQKLFDAIKRNGYKWNAEKKELEKLIEPKFKVGDRVVKKNGISIPILITKVGDELYYSNTANSIGVFKIIEQDDYELASVAVVPKFKVGDKVKSIFNNCQYIITKLTDTHYTLVEVINKLKYTEPIIEDKNWELVPNKFDIHTFNPFDKVLARYNKDSKWCGSFFSHIDKEHHSHCYKYVTTAGKSYPYCIPFEGNQHLLGTTDNCDDYYKTWE